MPFPPIGLAVSILGEMAIEVHGLPVRCLQFFFYNNSLCTVFGIESDLFTVTKFYTNTKGNLTPKEESLEESNAETDVQLMFSFQFVESSHKTGTNQCSPVPPACGPSANSTLAHKHKPVSTDIIFICIFS